VFEILVFKILVFKILVFETLVLETLMFETLVLETWRSKHERSFRLCGGGIQFQPEIDWHDDIGRG